MRITIETEIRFSVEMSASVTPSRPPPPCSNPDSPAFSDCGDSGEVEDFQFEFSSDEKEKIEKAVKKFLIREGDHSHSDLLCHLLDILSYDWAGDLADQFIESANDCDDGPDPDEKYDSRCDREFDERDRFDQ